MAVKQGVLRTDDPLSDEVASGHLRLDGQRNTFTKPNQDPPELVWPFSGATDEGEA